MMHFHKFNRKDWFHDTFRFNIEELERYDNLDILDDIQDSLDNDELSGWEAAFLDGYDHAVS